jgi:aspartyl-tRNA(Asn)/glutamyl-tRNA(Gln) amidotransferase subunit A
LAEAPRLGHLEGFFQDEASPEVWQSMQQTVERLQAAGAHIQPTALESDVAEVLKLHRRVMAVEAAEYHRAWFPERRAEYGKWIADLLDKGWNTTAIDYAGALRQQTEFQIEVLIALADADALILPSTVTPAPTVETTGDPRFNAIWSYCGLPTVTIPCSLSPDGLPLGLQLVGWPYQEGNLLAVAGWCEARLQFSEKPKLD